MEKKIQRVIDEIDSIISGSMDSGNVDLCLATATIHEVIRYKICIK